MNGDYIRGAGRMPGSTEHPVFFTSTPASRNKSLIEVTKTPTPRNPHRPREMHPIGDTNPHRLVK